MKFYKKIAPLPKSEALTPKKIFFDKLQTRLETKITRIDSRTSKNRRWQWINKLCTNCDISETIFQKKIFATKRNSTFSV